jgi:hypothetical protein
MWLGCLVTGDVEEAERRAGQLDRPERGVLNLDEKSLGYGLVPRVHLVDGPYPPGWYPHCVEAGKDLSGCQRGECILEQPDDIGTPLDSLRVGRQVRVEVQTEFGAEPLPLGVVSTGDLDRTFTAPEQPVRDDRGMVVAPSLTSDTRDGPRCALVTVRGNDGREK